jgi:uncharacterized membrane protein (UPF0127 family)
MGILSPSAQAPKRSRVFILIVLAAVLLLSSWFMANRKDEATIVVSLPNGESIEAEVADTPEKQFFGLAFRDALLPGWGMLYIFETSDFHRIRTKGYRIPVDLIWADESRHVVHVLENAPPCLEDPCPLYGPPPEKARYVLQTSAGFIRKEHMAPGMELKFTLKL